MKFKRLICLMLSVTMLLMCITTAYAGTNWDSGDAAGLAAALDGNNVWKVYDSSGAPIDCAEGLRVTVYDADNETKVFNTIDITGNPNIAGVTDIRYFADTYAGGKELIPKTSWLAANYIGSTYNVAGDSAKQSFHNRIASKLNINGYRSEYVPELASITIISENNTSNLEAIRALIGKKEFLVHLCSMIDGLEYRDFEEGKYKIAFEPTAYMTIAGSAWVLTATECGILDKYMLDILGSTTGALRTKMGPLTHSQLPLSAFLSYKELGVSKFEASESDISYSNSGELRYNNSCIIRSMGIGIVAGSAVDSEVAVVEDTITQYHTDTDVYTSFDFTNIGATDYVSASSFSIYNADGETPKTETGPAGNKIQVGVSVSQNEPGQPPTVTPIYGYDSTEVEMKYASPDSTIKVYVPNPKYETEPYGEEPYTLVGKYKDGEMMASSGGAGICYLVENSAGRTITEGTVYFSCPAGENAMGWFEWHTPSKAQDITITLTPTSSDIMIVDGNGHRYNSLEIQATITKVEEKTPPDPKVTDTRPTWQKIYSRSSIQDKIADYAPQDDIAELDWYVWAYGWEQYEVKPASKSFNYGTGLANGGTYDTYNFIAERWGIDNRYYANEQRMEADYLSGKIVVGAVVLTGEAHKVYYSVSLSADMTITPSQYCQTAEYSASASAYKMKSGYGFNIEVNTHLSGDTQYCTGSQVVNTLFPEFNFDLRSSADYNRLLEEVGGVWVFKENEYSTYDDRVHFTPIWYPDNKYYTVYAEVFDVWCPAGQLSVRMTDSMIIKGNVYDDWHIAPVNP